MEFHLLPGDNKEPITQLAVSADGTACFAGSSAGGFFKYSFDAGGLKRLETPRRYTSVVGLSFVGETSDAIGVALTAPANADVVRIFGAGLVELLYTDAPHPFQGMAMCPVADYGLMGSGEELLKWFIKERSYLPVDVSDVVQIRAVTFKGRSQEGLVVGHKDRVGFVARYEPKPETGRLASLATTALPLPRLATVASNASGTLFLAGGETGGLVEVDGGSYKTRFVPGPVGVVVHGSAFHPNDGWALIATGPRNRPRKDAALYRYEPGLSALTELYEGPSGAGAFLCVVMLPQGDRALVGTESGQLLQVAM